MICGPLPDARPWTTGVHYDHSDARRHTADGQRVLSVTGILKAAGKAGNFDGARPDDVALKAAIGRAVHDATHYYDEGDLASESALQREIVFRDRTVPGPLAYLDGWKAFRRERRFVPTLLETVVFSRRWGYIGRLDRLGAVDTGRRTVLLDIKIGDPEAARADLQLSGYLEALLEEEPTLAIDLPERWSVQLTPDGGYRLRRYPVSPRTARMDRAEFLEAVAASRGVAA
ncbi:MAG: PD-(D/E)XK nuclease family protein [Vicinamibacterales bacterium]